MKKSTHLGATWLNDAYNANPDSMRATLTWLSEFAHPEKVLPVLGDMLETGENVHKVHKEVLEYALELFPLATVVAVGPLMTKAAEEINSDQIITYPDSDACAANIATHVIPEGIVFLKASRGTRLEKVEPNDL
jgi:UDP-N-acetylmuramoyl-tripeptide--D-alanyl-D-alanine ligase